MATTITVRIKFFSGIDKDLKFENYNPAEGMSLTIPSGKRLKFALKSAGLTHFSSYAYYRSGERISTWTKLKEGDEISCLRPAGGG